MNIRFFQYLIPSLLLMIAAPNAFAVEAPARLLYKKGSHDDVLVISYKEGFVTYRLSKRALNQVRVGPSKLSAVYFYEPKIFTEAMDLYRGRKYAEAKEKFAECETAYKPVDTAPDNYGTLAGFYKLECNRRMGDLDALSSELEKFIKKGLTRETHLQQLEIYAFWEALRLKDWERLDLLAQAWVKRKVTGSQRAQIAYCHGLALEHIAKKDPSRMTDALNTYNQVITADFTTSHELVTNAFHHILGIYNDYPGVALAIRTWETEDENRNSTGYQYLIEANAMVKLYKQAGFERTRSLDSAYQKFFKYDAPDPDVEPKAAAEPKADEKPEADEKPKAEEKPEAAKEAKVSE
ncbi:MAG: hypothetical protein KJO21_08830 [Verrucomicrobiae bacterium]|nr:hypothetical protein [Verrucomicrobiae bacterium]NNJ42441.1 hypothetical protein [Akkermansiaceae bacterium]